MYTQGIRKIFMFDELGKSISYACEVVAKTKYLALCFNGQIYIRAKHNDNDWIATNFNVSDFEVRLK